MSGDRTERHCHYCGLPLKSSRSKRGGEIRFCCFGCRIAADIAQGDQGDENRTTATRLGIAIFFAMNVMVISMALWSREVYGDQAWSTPAAEALFGFLRYACLLLTAPVLILLGGPILANAIDQLRARTFSMDVLVLAGVVSAYLYSVVSVLREGPHTYFEVACLVLVFVTLGRWLEASGKLRATETIASLEKLLPTKVRIVASEASSKVEEQPLGELRIGQIVRVYPGERIPSDGRIRRNEALVDERLVTGESQPASKQVEDLVWAGSLNLDGDLWIEATARPNDGALHRLIHAVREAAAQKSGLQRAVDRVAQVVLPCVLLIAVTTLVAHWWTAGLAEALMAFLAVLLIACPCAIGVAGPLAVWTALSRAARHGVLFRNGEAVERLARIRCVCFDKTGTLTTGNPVVVDCFLDEGVEPTVLQKTATAAAVSKHPLSVALVEYCRQNGASRAATPANAIVHPGKGVELRSAQEHGTNHNDGNEALDDDSCFLGSLSWLEQAGQTMSPRLLSRLDAKHAATSRSIVAVGWGGKVRGLFALREELREEAHRALEALKASGLHVEALSGDRKASGQALAERLGVDVRTELLPEEKLARLKELRQGQRFVAMVGDGVNDAPALVEADVGIAMGCGADVTRDAADICLLGNDLERVAWSHALSKRTSRIVRQNLFWAFAYNLAGVSLAATGWLNPILASAAMVVSSLFVIANSLRLNLEEQETAATPAELEAVASEPAKSIMEGAA